MTRSRTDATVMGVIALELSAGRAPQRAALAPSQASALAECLGRDLAKHAPQVRGLDLVFAAAHFDPAEVLRPGWPLHQRLHELQQRAPGRGDGARVIAFGADEAGEVPMPFQADASLHGGPLRVLPFLLCGEDASTVTEVGVQFESVLLETGMAAADTALLAQKGFGADIEHARYLTVHDLAAMTAVQYDHGGLGALWPLIEAALLAPTTEQWLDAPPEPLVRYAKGEAHIALFEPASWRARYAADETDDARLERAYEYFQARQQQIAAVLEVHGVPVTFAHCPSVADARETLKS